MLLLPPLLHSMHASIFSNTKSKLTCSWRFWVMLGTGFTDEEGSCAETGTVACLRPGCTNPSVNRLFDHARWASFFRGILFSVSLYRRNLLATQTAEKRQRTRTTTLYKGRADAKELRKGFGFNYCELPLSTCSVTVIVERSFKLDFLSFAAVID